MSIFTLSGCSKNYGAKNQHKICAVKNANVIFEKGINFIIGKSGSGKSTLLKIMAGLLHPTEGEVIYNNTNLYELTEKERLRIRREEFGFIFQSYNLIEEFSVYENLLIPLLIKKDKNQKYLNEYIEKLGLQQFLHRMPKELSGGEQQRVAIARALINRPNVIFADEPTGNLDELNGQIVMKLLTHLCDDIGSTLIMVTHDQDLLKYSSVTYVMRDGNIQERG